MENNFDYLSNGISSSDKNVLKNISTLGEKLKELKKKQLDAEAVLEAAKKEYEHFANVILPQEMFSCGIDSISLSTGGTIQLKRTFYCKPNKNEEDKRIIAEWLRSHGGAHIVEHDATVSAEDMNALNENNIPFIENTTVNTAKLKSFLKDGIGATTGVQKFTISDIPKCMHFQEVTVAEINQ